MSTEPVLVIPTPSELTAGVDGPSPLDCLDINISDSLAIYPLNQGLGPGVCGMRALLTHVCVGVATSGQKPGHMLTRTAPLAQRGSGAPSGGLKPQHPQTCMPKPEGNPFQLEAGNLGADPIAAAEPDLLEFPERVEAGSGPQTRRLLARRSYVGLGSLHT